MLYELRSYTVHPGRMPALLARFRTVTSKLFEKHGIQNVGYWTNVVGGRNDEMLYILAFEDMAHRDRAWSAFQSDPEWIRERAASEQDGPIVAYVENRFMAPTDFSPLR